MQDEQGQDLSSLFSNDGMKWLDRRSRVTLVQSVQMRLVGWSSRSLYGPQSDTDTHEYLPTNEMILLGLDSQGLLGRIGRMDVSGGVFPPS